VPHSDPDVAGSVGGRNVSIMGALTKMRRDRTCHS